MQFKHIPYILCCTFFVIYYFVEAKVHRNLRKQLFVITCLTVLTFTFVWVWEKEDLAAITIGLTTILFKRTLAQVARRYFAWKNFKRVKRQAKLHISWKEPEPVKNSAHEIMFLIIGIILVISGLLSVLRSQL